MDEHALLVGIRSDLKTLINKLCMPNNIIQIKNSRFYLPNYPQDCIQTCMVQCLDYWDREALEMINKYLPDDAVILDVGANIGNHSVYWGIERNAKKIYAFEPLKGTYEILLKNIELNELQDIVIPYNIGLSDEEIQASVQTFMPTNIGGTAFKKNPKGNFKFRPLDALDIPEKIDLIKIDVEGHEIEMLMGGVKTLNKNKPVVVIETFTHKKEVDTIFDELGYKQVGTIREGEDYIYKYAGK